MRWTYKSEPENRLLKTHELLHVRKYLNSFFEVEKSKKKE